MENAVVGVIPDTMPSRDVAELSVQLAQLSQVVFDPLVAIPSHVILA